METSEVARAVGAAVSVAASLDLPVDEASVLHNSNRLAVRLLPCGVLARVGPAVAPGGCAVRQFEVEVAAQLAATGCPVAGPDPRVEPRIFEHDGYAVTLWTYYEPRPAPRGTGATDYADALARLHAGMRTLDIATPHFTDRVAEAQHLIADHDRTPTLRAGDRELLGDVLRTQRQVVADWDVPTQPLHGEPHPGNLLATHRGLLFIDLETCCRGPVEFDLAHAPEEVSACYPGADDALLAECRLVVLAMVAAWRWDRHDEFPDGHEFGDLMLRAIRSGPPWPSIETVMRPSRPSR